MKTSIEIQDQVWQVLRLIAVTNTRPATEIIDEALRSYLRSYFKKVGGDEPLRAYLEASGVGSDSLPARVDRRRREHRKPRPEKGAKK